MGFEDIIEEERKKAQKALDSFVCRKISESSGAIKKAYEAIREYTGKGKMLRPIIMAMAYKAFGGKEDIYDKCLCVELVHNSTLVHDDLMDEDSLRRGKPTIHSVFDEGKGKAELFIDAGKKRGASYAIIIGNIMYKDAIEAISGNDKAVEMLNSAYGTVNEGQLLDMEELDERGYLEMIEKKTGELIKVSAQLGALLAGAGEEQIKAIGRYAANIATAFQIRDDIIDLGDNKGREKGTDIRQGKRTLLIIRAEKACKIDKDNVDQAIRSIRNSGAVDYCEKIAENRVNEAKKIIESILDDDNKFFSELADYMIKRKK